MWAVIVGVGVVTGAIVETYGVLHETGVIETTPTNVIELPGNLQEILDRGAYAFPVLEEAVEKYSRELKEVE